MTTTLSPDESIAFLQTLVAMPDAVASKASVIAIAEAAGLPAGDFIAGDPSERTLEYIGRAMGAWGTVPSQAVRAIFFMLATDPGDIDDFGVADQSADQTPRPGFLSAFGAGWWGTQRGGQTVATAFVTIKNNGSTTATFGPGQLTFEQSFATRSDGGTPTYSNSPDPGIYSGIGGTLTLASGATSPPLPVHAQQLGAYGSASGPGAIDHVVTQSFGDLIVITSTAATGEDREARAEYIARCLLAGDSNAPGGPTRAYQRAATTGSDGAPLTNYSTGSPVAIIGAQVIPSSAAGTVIGYLYGLDGAVPTTDVSSANWNITGSPATLGLLTGEPLGVLPDTVQIGPLTTDAGTGGPGFASATNQPVPVNYSAKMKANSVPSGAPPGTYGVPWALSTAYAVSQKVQHGSNIYVCTVAGTSASSGGPTGTGTGITDGSCTWNFSASGASPTSTGIPTVQIAISAALGSYLPRLGPGGIDQVSGAGVVYTPDLQDVVKDSIAGLYNVVLTVPSVGATAVPLGSITVAGAVTGTITVAS